MTLRERLPVRSDLPQRESYTAYRAELRADFNQCCGYCDDSDELMDSVSFHIDHFAPKSKFKHLEVAYSNLVYSCRFCNIRKSNRWVGKDPTVPNDGTSGFVDPCGADYDDHLERLADGQIVAKTPLGDYMIKHLNLHLLRHRVLWEARRARKLRKQVDALINQIEESGRDDIPEYVELLKRWKLLTESSEKYEGLARTHR